MAQNPQVIVLPVNNDGNDDNDGVPIHHAQAVQGADGGINLKVEQTKLPEFWGQREKDSITANAFIQRVDNMMAANNWSDQGLLWPTQHHQYHHHGGLRLLHGSTSRTSVDRQHTK